jgi:hypothetical protein
MGQIWVREFTGGLDSRRLPETTKGGALILGNDGHINRGGEFEKRAAFVKLGTFPAGNTKGLANSPSGLYAFGHLEDPGAMPAGVAYQRLVHPSDASQAIARVLSFTLSSGKIYVAVEFEDGRVAHYYDGTFVSDWFDGRARATITVTGGSSGDTITSIKVGGVEILGATITYSTTPEDFALALANQINTYASTPEYSATNEGKDVTIVSADSTANSLSVTIAATGVTTSPATIVMGGGATSGSTFQPGPYVKGLKKKMYGLSGPNMHFSGIQQPTKFNTDTVGAGFIDMSTEAEGSEALTAVAPYQQWIAVFSERVVQIWYVDPDPTLYRQVQVLGNTGTASPRSVTQFGDNDLFYLDESGVRSLRARDASNAAATTDTGTQIDTLVTADLRALSTADRQNHVISVIEPRDKRFWLAVKDKIYVFSFFDAAKISAWTVYQPGFVIEDMIVHRRKVYLRSGDDLYVYGGLEDELEYDDTQAEAWIPFLDGDDPSKLKTLTGIDAAVEGQWEIRMGMQPTNLNASDLLGEITQTTFNGPGFDGLGQTTHFSPRLKSIGDGPAVISSFVIHYMVDQSED